MVELLRAIFEECAAVAARARDRAARSRSTGGSRPGIAVGDHKTSMLQDLEAGKPLELDCMSGAVIELADRLGIAVPHTRAVHACAKLLDARARSGGTLRDRLRLRGRRRAVAGPVPRPEP